MLGAAVFTSDPWRRFVLRYYSAIIVRFIFLRSRLKVLADDLLTLSSTSGRFATAEHRLAVDQYWGRYWYLRDQQEELRAEQDLLLVDLWETLQLVRTTNLLQQPAVFSRDAPTGQS